MKLSESQSSEAERSRWQAVRRDTMQSLPGLILEADEDTGVVKMRERGLDEIKDGVRTPTFRQVAYQLGAQGLSIVRSR